MLRNRVAVAVVAALAVAVGGCSGVQRKTPELPLPSPTYKVKAQDDCVHAVALKPVKNVYQVSVEDAQTVNIIRDLCDQPAKDYNPGKIRSRKSGNAGADSVTADGCLVGTAEQTGPNSPNPLGDPLCFQQVPTNTAQDLANGKYSGAHSFNMVRDATGTSDGPKNSASIDKPSIFAWHHNTGNLDYFYIRGTLPLAYQALVVMHLSPKGGKAKSGREAEESDNDAQIWFVESVANGTNSESFVLNYHGTFEQLRNKQSPDVVGAVEHGLKPVIKQWNVYRSIVG